MPLVGVLPAGGKRKKNERKKEMGETKSFKWKWTGVVFVAADVKLAGNHWDTLTAFFLSGNVFFSYVSVWITADKKNFRVLFTVQDNLLVASNETPPLLLLTPLIGWVKSPLSLTSSSRGSFQDGRGKCPS